MNQILKHQTSRFHYGSKVPAVTILNRYLQHARVFDWQHICYVWWTCFSTDSLWVQTVLLLSLTASFICMRQTSYRLLKKNEKKLARSFNITFRYIDDVLSLSNSRLGDFVDRIYPIELEIKDSSDSEGRLRTKFYDKRDDFYFPIVNFPFICSNIPTYGVYISQLVRYFRVCGSYQDFLDTGWLLTRSLLNQGFLLVKLKSSLRKFYGRHHDLVDRYGISVS